ncbi:MAG: DUF2807 domain-containing protein [Chloroflexota bacterium]
MKQRSFFGPLLLIAVGVVWLLISLHVIPAGNLWALTRIWPYVLIALGIGMIISAQWAGAGRIVSILVLLGAMGAVVFAPQLGWAGGPDLNWNFDGDFGGGVQGSGQIKTETREVSDFQAISLDYPAEYVVEMGDTESVKITADDNLLTQFSTKVRDGVLVIENSERNWSKRVDPSQAVKITITVKDLNRIEFGSAGTLLVKDLETEELRLVLSGAGEATLKNLKAGRFENVLSGAGTIKADGTADVLTLTLSGFGTFEAPDLESQTAEIRISGAGSATVRVADNLKANVSGAGSIDYYGSPAVDRNVSGAGSINHAGD